MEKNLRKNNAITLVALVITIIVLLILAGVGIATLTQTGLFENAKQAKNVTENAQNTENTMLANYEATINEIVGSSSREKEIQIEVIDTKIHGEDNVLEKIYNVEEKGKIVINLFSCQGSGGARAIEFYCKKNGENINPVKQVTNGSLRIQNIYVVDVNKDDKIECKARSSGAWGDNGYTMFFIK